jgi:hypothetical protein
MAMCAPTELMFTIRPRALRISGRNACVTAICPNTSTSNMRCSSAGVTYSMGPASPTPATFTRPTNGRPLSCPLTSVAAPAIEAGSVTSSMIGMTPSPASFTSAAPSAGRRTPANT